MLLSVLFFHLSFALQSSNRTSFFHPQEAGKLCEERLGVSG